MVILDRFVQRHFVLDLVLLSVLIFPSNLEGTRSELEAFLDLKSALSECFFSMKSAAERE